MSNLRFGSVCSGIEAASVAWHPLGWQAAWLSEIEAFPSSVLAHHYPAVENLGDMTKIVDYLQLGLIEAPDVLCGGTPCQAFSVAGLRKSLTDARGNLSLTFCEIANEIDIQRELGCNPAAIIFWENVPGVLNTADNAFGCFLAALAGEDDALVAPGGKWSNAGCVYGPQRTVAWRVLDAQYFGVAQRRRRVFVVASARDGFDPAAVLFECEGARRDTAPSRVTGQEVTGTISARTSGGGGLGTDFECIGGLQPYIAATLEASAGRSRGAGTPTSMLTPVTCMAHGQGGAEISVERSPTLTCNHEAPIAAYALQHAQIGRKDSAGPQGKGWQEELAFTQDSRSCADAVAIAYGVGELIGAFKGGQGAKAGGIGFSETLSPTLSSADSGSNRTPVIAFVQNSRDEVRLMGGDGSIVGALAAQPGAKQQCYVAQCVTGDITHTLKAGGFDASEDGTGRGQPIVAAVFQQSSMKGRGTIGYDNSGVAKPVKTQMDGQMVQAGMAVRRLTPVECARLQGFPDHYLDITVRGKPAADGPKYKALGNSWAVPVVRWIGARIDAAVTELDLI